jgi:hypothetical protein
MLFPQNLLDAFAGGLGAENIERIEDSYAECFPGYGDAQCINHLADLQLLFFEVGFEAVFEFRCILRVSGLEAS